MPIYFRYSHVSSYCQ